MLTSALRTTLRAIFTLGLIVTSSPAQTPSPCGMMANGIMWYVSGGNTPTTNAPFSATIRTTHDQKFVDGNVIHGQIVTHAYRDSAGRVRSETSGLCNFDPDGQLRPTFTISVDEAARRAEALEAQGIEDNSTSKNARCGAPGSAGEELLHC